MTEIAEDGAELEAAKVAVLDFFMDADQATLDRIRGVVSTSESFPGSTIEFMLALFGGLPEQPDTETSSQTRM